MTTQTTHYYPRGPVMGVVTSNSASAAFMVPMAEWLDAEEAREYVETEYPEDLTEGWYSRLTAPGYMDSTDWLGPFPNLFRAIREVCRLYEVDLDGNSYE